MLRDAQDSKVEGWFCVCLECGARTPRLRTVTCLETKCPKCGAVMVREHSPYHEYALRRRMAADLRVALARRGVEMKPREEPVPEVLAEEQGIPGELSLT